ncbi:hypothetical protein F4679DRAFT_551245 [Xylaria curta]|nr:hypothetical protein F4679DRAFT_551245 [Xylaria curta]
MSPPPLPLPSKAAIRALRSIALGTSCAIGVLIEDRRRRISTLKTAVANKQKLQSSRQYHHNSLEELSWQLGAATVLECSLQGYEKEDHGLGRHGNAETTRHTAFKGAAAVNSEVQYSSIQEGDPNPIQRPQPIASQTSPPPPSTVQAASLITKRQIQSSMSSDSPNISLVSKAIGTCQPTLSATLGQSQDDLIRSIEGLLANTDEESLDRAVKLFMLGRPSTPSDPLLDRWIELSIHISRKCQISGMWEEASQILITIISLGPIDEAKYLAYNPLPIIESHLCRSHPDIPPSADRVTSAAKLYLPKFKATPHPRGMDWERVGRSLVLETLSSRFFILSQNVYWRTLCWAPKPVDFVGWAIRTFFQHSDHKTVVRIFLSQYSHMKPSREHFNETMDYVVESVLAMKGAHANEILEAFAKMDCPGNGKLRSRWVMRLLQAHWARQEGLSRTIELFEKAVSLGLLDKITHPQGVYRTLIEMAVKADDEEVAYAYADELTREYPDMKKDIDLKLAGLKAKEGDWDSVLWAFRQVRPSELAEPTLYNDAFIFVLKVFADSHSAAEAQDFALTFIRDMGIKFHPHMVTLIAKRYAEERDMRGFVTWLKLCSREGLTLDAGFCNAVLHNCSTTWKLSFPELCAIHSQFKELDPHYADEVTQRILTRAAHHEGREYSYSGCTKKAITVHRMTHRGRTTNQRDIYHAMNQELMRHKPTSAVMVYKRATRFGMPFNGHCFRLAVLATAQSKSYGSDYALALLRDAHAEGRDVEAAISTFIRHDIAGFHGNPRDVIIHIRNLLGRLESSQIPISAAVLTHMAYVCVQIRQHEKAVILCNIARDRSGTSHPFLSKKSFMVLASAYSELLDVAGMKSVIDHLSDSKYSTDKILLSHLRSIRRLVRKKDPNDRRIATLEEILDRGILQIVQMRAKVRTEGKLISHETLRIVGDALADLQRGNTEESTLQPFTSTDIKWEKRDSSIKRQVMAQGPVQLVAVS